MNTCPHHQELETKLDILIQSHIRLATALEESVVRKDQLYLELEKVYARINDDGDKFRRLVNSRVGVLSGVLVFLGGLSGYLLKSL